MAIYPEGNPGVVPVDPDTDLGQLRAALQDMHYTEYDPPVPGFGNFAKFSDAELESFLLLGQGSLARAISIGYATLATSAQTGTVRTDDLTLQQGDSEVNKWLALAKYWGDLADAEGEDFGGIYYPGGNLGFIPEGQMAQWGRRYTWDRWR